jgi:putative nucleotidyltransferase with HDIG domain
VSAEPQTDNARASRAFIPYMLVISLTGYAVLARLTTDQLLNMRLLSLVGPMLFFTGLAIIVGLQSVRMPRGGATTTVGFAIDYASLLIFGPALAGWIGVLSALVLLRRSPWLRQLFNHAQLALSFAAAGWVYYHLGGRYVIVAAPETAATVITQQVPFGHLVPALVGGGLGYFLVSSFLLAIAMALWERRSILDVWAVSFRWAVPRYLALAPFGLLMAMAYGTPEIGTWAVALFLVPLIGARYAFQGAMEMLQVHRETVYALSHALEAYDPYTRNHSELVTRYALQLGRSLGLSEPQMETLEWAGKLHDIGKCRQDWEPIIRKPGKPSEREWQVIRQHPVEGSRLAEKMEFLPHTAGVVAKIVRAHHERLDGSGYPDGLKGAEIPFEARILCVADAFEAMTARRAYQRKRSLDDAVEEMQRCAGTQFDAAVVAALVGLWERGELDLEVNDVAMKPAFSLASQGLGGVN